MGSSREAGAPRNEANDGRSKIDGNHETAGTQKMGIGRNTIFGMAIDAVIFGLGIAVSIVLTRSLGPQRRGVYVLLSTMLARGRYRLGEVNVVALLIAIAMGVLCLIGVGLLFPLVADNIFHSVPYGFLLVALVLIPTTIYQIYWSSMMIGTHRVFLLN